MIRIPTCGYNSQHPLPFEMEHKKGLPEYLLLLVKTDAWFALGGEQVQTRPGMAILFPKQTYIRYGCLHAGYNDDWLHFRFDAPQEEQFLENLQIPFQRPLYVPEPHSLSRYLQLLNGVYRSDTPNRAQILDALARALLYALDGQLRQPYDARMSNKYYPAFLQMRAELYNTPASDWSAEGMAAVQNLSLSYFQHLYKQFFRCACQQDIIRARLSQAEFYLTTTDMRIRRLAELCGYQNESHFMRQFKKVEGMTPSEFRRLQNRPG